MRSEIITLRGGAEFQHDEVAMAELLADWLACGLGRKCEVRETVTALLSLDLLLDPFLLRLLSG